MSSTDTLPTSRMDRLLNGVERIGNKLPDPFLLFLGLFLIVGVISTAMALAGTVVTILGSDEPKVIKGLFTGEGLAWFTANLGQNFIGFPPLETVLTILLGVTVAQRTGLLSAAIRLTLGRAPRWPLPYAVGAVGVTGSVMADASMIIIPPLAAMVFKAAGRHPMAGLIGGFAAAGAGYSTSPVVTSLDALFAGITTSVVATLPNPGAPVTPVSNYYYFNLVSSVVLAILAGFHHRQGDRTATAPAERTHRVRRRRSRGAGGRTGRRERAGRPRTAARRHPRPEPRPRPGRTTRSAAGHHRRVGTGRPDAGGGIAADVAVAQ
ncbi:AbgT family transporter [Naumannella halotolerans]|uniref:AbgT family transporter n=1 Tax=Naumannella halotolerans TaxID=993414 RepID=UPI001AAEBF90|nr:AbgT family transporter [Naumannella halotolerans]